MHRASRLAGLARHAAKAVNIQHSAVTVTGCRLLPCQVQQLTAASLPSSLCKVSRSFSSGVFTAEDIEPGLARGAMVWWLPKKGFRKSFSFLQSGGCHVITRNLLQELPELGEYEIGMVNLFVMHTSASLTINENASSDVPQDLNDSLDCIAPEGLHNRHADEGSDDMPAHVKTLRDICNCVPRVWSSSHD